MKLLHTGLLSLAAIILPLAAHASTVCPALNATAGTAYKGAIAGAGTNCNTIITINADSTLTITYPNANPYDGNDDNYVGVVNNSASAVGSLTLTGSGVFGSDGDGIDSFGIAGNSTDIAKYGANAYGGTDAFFTNIVGNTGTVNFIGGIGTGGTGYFSLENAPNSVGITGTVGPGVTPEPSSLILLGTGVLAVAGAVRRRLIA